MLQDPQQLLLQLLRLPPRPVLQPRGQLLLPQTLELVEGHAEHLLGDERLDLPAALYYFL